VVIEVFLQQARSGEELQKRVHGWLIYATGPNLRRRVDVFNAYRSYFHA
jgi:hypothetical protein